MNETEKRYEKTAVVTGASKGIGYELVSYTTEPYEKKGLFGWGRK